TSWFWLIISPRPQCAGWMSVSMSTALNPPVLTTGPATSSARLPLKLKLKLTPLPPELVTVTQQSEKPPTVPDPCAETVCAFALSAKNADSASMSATISLRVMPVTPSVRCYALVYVDVPARHGGAVDAGDA